MRRLAALWFLVWASPVWAACADEDTADTGGVSVGEEDCDDDNWTKAEGDCNDENPEVNPGKQVDRCDDSDDNNCDGYFNEGCELSFARGTLIGGSSCQDNTATAAWLGLVPLALFARRRRRTT
jgi:uncharacterized protein (TIGR03382 family)